MRVFGNALRGFGALGLVAGAFAAAAVGADVSIDDPANDLTVGHDVVYSADGEWLLWISLERALDAEGEVRWELFAPGALDDHRRQVAAAAEAAARGVDVRASCTHGNICRANQKPHGSLDDLVTHAEAIVAGRVVASEVGLNGGANPATLLRVRPLEVLRRGGLSLDDGEDLTVLVGTGVVELAGLRLCYRDSHGIEDLPAVGDEVLLMPFYGPIDTDERVVRVSGEELIAVPAGSGPVAAYSLFDRAEIEAQPDLDALLALVRAKIEGDPAARPFDLEACTPAVLRGIEDWVYERRFASLAEAKEAARWAGRQRRLLVLDPARNAFPGLSGLDATIPFDLDGDGALELTTWPKPGRLLPWIDRNGDGLPTDGSELIQCDCARREPDGPRTAFEALARWDLAENGGDGDGAITAGDGIWSRLGLWADLDRDGIATPAELLRPADICLEAISLETVEAGPHDGHGNRLWAKAEIHRRDARGKPLKALAFEISPIEEQ